MHRRSGRNAVAVGSAQSLGPSRDKWSVSTHARSPFKMAALEVMPCKWNFTDKKKMFFLAFIQGQCICINILNSFLIPKVGFLAKETLALYPTLEW